jgi:hypothetical protein
MLGKICLYSALPLTLALAAPSAKADFLQDFQTCNVDPIQYPYSFDSPSEKQECYTVMRGGIWLTAVSLSQTNEALKNQCGQNPTSPNQKLELKSFFEGPFTECNVEFAPPNYTECYNVLRWGYLIYTNSLNEAKDSLTECTQVQAAATAPTTTTIDGTTAYRLPTTSTETLLDGNKKRLIDGGTTSIGNGPQPAIDGSSLFIGNGPQPAINY